MSYITISGDTFDKIALQQWNDERLAVNLIEANIEYADIVIFPAGVELNIPIVDTIASSNLPPWKRDDSVDS